MGMAQCCNETRCDKEHGDQYPDISFVPNASNQRLLRDALGCFATGVTIVTAAAKDGPAAITVNSFASVSLTPPLVLWSLDRNSSRYRDFTNATHYAIHVLDAHQESLCMQVARDPTLLHNRNLETNDNGVPVLSSCLARFDCKREAIHEGGDHIIIVGRIQAASMADNQAPLIFFRGTTGLFTSSTASAA